MTKTDLDLLREYTRRNSEEAFAELVNRHLNLVYSAALRQVRSPQLAEEIAQSAFTDLARNAPRLAPDTILPAWLYQVTRRTAIDVTRREARRQLREQIATEMNAMNATAADWTHIEPLLDEAMHALDETDRAAVLLRYFENKSLREVGATLGTSDDAAQKRVSRAVERLREFFAKRGVTIGASGLVVIISANAVQAAPVGLAVTISSAIALAGTTLATTATATAAKAIAMTTLQKVLITAAFVTAVGVGGFEAHQATQLRAQNKTLQQQQEPLAGQIQQLQSERDDATNRVASLVDELAKAKSDKLELLRLRNEISMLRHPPAANQTPTGSSLPTETAANNEHSLADMGRELGMAVVRGDVGAFDKLLAESKTEHESFSTNRVGVGDSKLGELAVQTFTPINTAFKVIEEAATKGNQTALDALSRALQSTELRGNAVNSLGTLAGTGDEVALDVLLHPEKYGALLASTVSALQPAADNGNQKAIDALANIANEPTDRALWFLAAESLTKAAAAGNPVAIDALIKMSSDTNRSVQNAVAEGLRQAANQNAKAAEALRVMDFH